MKKKKVAAKKTPARAKKVAKKVVKKVAKKVVKKVAKKAKRVVTDDRAVLALEKISDSLDSIFLLLTAAFEQPAEVQDDPDYLVDLGEEEEDADDTADDAT